MKIPLNVPNVLSLFRLCSLPVVLYLVYAGYETAFVIFFVFNQITDIVDGYWARKFDQQTEIGSLLDSYADIGSYVSAFAGILKFHTELFTNYGVWLILFGVVYILQMLICKIKYKRWVAGLHLYSCKATGYFQGSFLVVLFVYGFVEYFYYFMIVFGILSELEAITINVLSPLPIINAKGLYWIVKENRMKDSL